MLLVLAFFPTKPAIAETAKTVDLMDLSIEELRTVQITTVTAASKYEQKVTEAPASISVITADDIRKFGYRTLADILRSVRSFYVTYDRNYSYYGVRGFSRPGDFNTRILLMVDGHRMNDNIYDQAPLGTEFQLDVDLIERIEIIRGPGSSLYGSNAFFGVINVVTKSGKDLVGTELAASAGSFETYAGRVTYGARGPDGNFLLSGSGYDSKGPHRLSYPEFASVNNGIAENVDNDRYHDFFTKISFRDFTLEGAYGYREKGVPTASYGAVFNAADNRSLDENAYLDLAYRHQFRGVSAMAKVYYDVKNYWEDYLLDYPPLTLNRDTAFGKWWGGEVQGTGLFLRRHTITAGAEYKDNLQQDQSNFDRDPPYTYLDERRKSRLWAFYVEDEYRVLNTVLVNMGVRRDHYSSFGDTTNPRVALIYTPYEKTIFKLLYGTAFRAPNVFEMYYADGVTAKSNADLKPEKIKTTEFVYEQYLGAHIRTSFSGFLYRIDNLITSVTDSADGMSQFRNVEKTDARGVELELEGTWENGLRGRVSYTLQKAKNVNTGRVLTNSPEQLAKLDIVIPLVRDRVFFDPEMQFMDKRRTVGGDYAPAFTVVNVTVFARRLAAGLDASLSLYNAFDKRYGDPGAGPPQHAQDVIVQDGRTFRFKLTYAF
jgi:outer membrane receptor for ferrienterochelin and colicins